MTSPQTPSMPGMSPNMDDAPPIPGLAFRPFRGAADYEGMAASYTASNQADNVGYAISPGDLERVYTGDPNIDTSRDLLIAEVDGPIVSYTLTTWWDDLKNIRIYYHNTFTRPDWRNKGIEPASLRRAEHRLREMAASDSTTNQRVLESVANNTAPERGAMLQAEG